MKTFFKYGSKPLMVMVCLVYANILHAQTDVYIKSIPVYNLDKSSLSISGNLVIDDGGVKDSDTKLHNSGIIYLKGHLINKTDSLLSTSSVGLRVNDTTTHLTDALGKIVFCADGHRQYVKSKSSIHFAKIDINNQNILIFDSTGHEILDTLVLSSGSLNLAGHPLMLYNTSFNHNNGLLLFENNQHQVLDTSYSSYIQAWKRQKNEDASEYKFGNIGFELNGVYNKPMYIKRLQTYDSSITDTSLLKVYEIDTLEFQGGNYGIKIHYIDSADFKNNRVSEEDITIWKYNHNPNRRYTNNKGDIDTSNNYIEGDIYLHATKYTLADEICEVLPNIDIKVDKVSTDFYHYCEGDDFPRVFLFTTQLLE